MAPGRKPAVERKKAGASKACTISFNKVRTPEDSRKFVGKFMGIALSHILASRRLLHTDYFINAKLQEGGVVRYLRDDSPFTRTIWKLIHGAQEAIHRQYLEQFMVVVGNNGEDIKDATEVYCFKILYEPNGEASICLTSPEGKKLNLIKQSSPGRQPDPNVVRQSLSLMRYVFRNCMVSNKDADLSSLSFRLTYTEGTPKGYHPEDYYQGDDDLFHMEDPEIVPVAAIPAGQTSALLSICVSGESSARSLAESVEAYTAPENGFDGTLNDTIMPVRTQSSSHMSTKSPGRTGRLIEN